MWGRIWREAENACFKVKDGAIIGWGGVQGNILGGGADVRGERAYVAFYSYMLIKFCCVLTYPPYQLGYCNSHTTGMNHLKIKGWNGVSDRCRWRCRRTGGTKCSNSRSIQHNT